MGDLSRLGASPQVAWQCTSIYDYSIFETFSRLISNLVVTQPHGQCVEQLLDNLVQNCRMERAFIFDVVSKVYLCSDSVVSGGSDDLTYELMADMLDVIVDTSCIYGM